MAISLRENVLEAHEMPRSDAVLQARAEFLPPKERDLLLAVLIRGQPAAEIGRLCGVNDRTIRQRVYRLSRRINSRAFLRAVRAMNYLDSPEAEIARLYYCHGLSQRKLAERLNMTPHEARRSVNAVAAKIDAILRMTRRSAG